MSIRFVVAFLQSFWLFVNLILCWRHPAGDAHVGVFETGRSEEEEEEQKSLEDVFDSTEAWDSQGPLGNYESGNRLKNPLTSLLKHNPIGVLITPPWSWLPSDGSRSPGRVSFDADAVSEKLHPFGLATFAEEKRVRYLHEIPYWVHLSAFRSFSCNYSYLSQFWINSFLKNACKMF